MATQEEMALEMAKAAAGSAGKESVNKLAAVIGGFFPFFGARREAVSTYIKDIQKSDLSPEAKMMAIANAKKTYKQLKNQMAIAEIAQNAARDGTDFSMQSGVDDEWLERFMDSAKFVSDEEVQLLWGNILAKEFEEPNSTPPSVIRILSEITPPYARMFQVLCSLECTFSVEGDTDETIIILPNEYRYLREFGLQFEELAELEMLGLIQFDPNAGYIVEFDRSKYPKIRCTYGKEEIVITEYPDKQFPIGIVILTKAGKSIARFATKNPIDGHFREVCNYLRQRNCKLSETHSE